MHGEYNAACLAFVLVVVDEMASVALVDFPGRWEITGSNYHGGWRRDVETRR